MAKAKKRTSKPAKKNSTLHFKTKWVLICLGLMIFIFGVIWLRSKTNLPVSAPGTPSTPPSSVPEIKPRTAQNTSPTENTFYSKLEKLGSLSDPIILASGTIAHLKNPMKYIFALPAHWKFYHFDDPQEFIQKSNFDRLQGPCIMITQGESHASLKEALNSDKTMRNQRSNAPYSLREAMEFEISGIPALISKLSSPPVLNVLVVKKRAFTLLFRACQKTPEDDFYRVIGNIQIEPDDGSQNFDGN